MMLKGRKIYLVHRVGWYLDYNGGFSKTDEEFTIPVRGFDTRIEAETCCRELEAKVRQEVSPFRFSDDLNLVTRLGETEFFEQLTALNISLPTKKQSPYGEYIILSDWWENIVGTLTDEQREGVWDLLDLLTFYTVAETTLED